MIWVRARLAGEAKLSSLIRHLHQDIKLGQELVTYLTGIPDTGPCTRPDSGSLYLLKIMTFQKKSIFTCILHSSLRHHQLPAA